MRMNLFKNNSSVTRWLVSYLVIILSMLTTMAIIIGVYTTTLRKEMNEYNEFVFESVANSVNEVLLSVNDLHMQLTNNRNIEKFISYSGDRYESALTYELIDELNSYSLFTSNVDRFFLYLTDEDMVLSNNGFTDSYSYYKYYFDSKKISYEEWKGLFHDFTNDRYISITAKNRNGVAADSLGFLFSLPPGNPDAVGVILCDKQYFMKNVENFEWKSLFDIYIYNGEGRLMLYDKNSQEGELPKTLADIQKYETEGNRVFRRTINSDKYYWQLVSVVSEEALNSGMYITQVMIIVIVVLSLLLLTFLVRYLMKMNRKPLQAMLSMFGYTSKSKDEFAELRNMINETLEHNNSLMKNLAVRDSELKQVAISKIIKGTLPGSHLAEYNINFKGENYVIISFYMKEPEQLFREDTHMPNFERLYHLRYIINNVMEELFAEIGCRLYTTEIDSYIVCLASLTQNIAQNQVFKTVEKGVLCINQHFDIELYYAVSEIYDAFLDISIAYAQTVEILEYKQIMNKDTNISYAQMREEKAEHYIFDLQTEGKLVHYIKTGNTQEAQAVVALIFNELAGSLKYSADQIRYVVFDIATTITKSVANIRKDSIDYITQNNLYKNICEGTDLRKMKTEIEQYIETVSKETHQEKRKKRQRYTSDDIKKYVHENLTDSTLNLESISAYFNMTPTYISRLFKDSEGISLIDYIMKSRYQRALELMAEEKYSTREISEMVGFGHERTFYRAQKKFKM